jgi:hypothetical protein
VAGVSTRGLLHAAAKGKDTFSGLLERVPSVEDAQ